MELTVLEGGPRPAPFEWTDLSIKRAQGAPEVEQLIAGFLYENQVHLLLGYGGSGKSLLCLWACLQLIRQGKTIAYLDEQNGIWEMVRRIDALGYTDHELEHLRYADFTKVPLVKRYDEVATLVEGCDVLVIDSLSDFIHNESDGSEYQTENSNAFVGHIFRESIERFRTEMGMTVLIIDHLSKADDQRARGAVIKDDLVQIVWALKVSRTWNKHKDGNFTLTKGKCRLPDVPDQIKAHIDPRGQNLEPPIPIKYTINPVWDADAPDEDIPTVKVDIPTELTRVLAESGPRTMNQLMEAIPGRQADLRKYLKRVREKGHRNIRVTRDGRSTVYSIELELIGGVHVI